jgi:hypothetical protein
MGAGPLIGGMLLMGGAGAAGSSRTGGSLPSAPPQNMSNGGEVQPKATRLKGAVDNS